MELPEVPITYRVLIHLPTPGGKITGAPRRTLLLCETLRSRGLTVGVAGDPLDDFVIEAARRGFDLLPMPRPEVLSRSHRAVLRSGGWTFLRAVAGLISQNWAFLRAIRSWHPDVLWTRSSVGLAFVGLAAAVTRRPLVWDLAYELPSAGVVKLLHRAGLFLADRIVLQYAAAGGRFFGSTLAAKYAAKFHPLTPAIEVAPLVPFRERRASAEVAEQPLVILQVATVSDRKNQAFGIECLAALRRTGADVEFWIAGFDYDEAYARRLPALADNLGVREHVKFLGWRDDVHDLMARSAILILPSRDEGVPNAVQEAMFLGLPVVTSDAGGLPEILENGVTGWSLPLDFGAWTAVLGALVADAGLRQRIGAAAARYASERFAELTWPDQYAALIRNVAEARQRRR